MNNYIVIILFGPCGSGKEELLNELLKNNSSFNKIVNTTNKKNDKKNIYLSTENFTKKILEGSIIEATSKEGHFFGTDINSLKKDKINIKISNIEGIECFLEYKNIKTIPIYIATEPKTRLLRMLNREKNCDNICESFLEDQKYYNQDIKFDFKTFYYGKNIKTKDFNNYINDLIKNV